MLLRYLRFIPKAAAQARRRAGHPNPAVRFALANRKRGLTLGAAETGFTERFANDADPAVRRLALERLHGADEFEFMAEEAAQLPEPPAAPTAPPAAE